MGGGGGQGDLLVTAQLAVDEAKEQAVLLASQRAEVPESSRSIEGGGEGRGGEQSSKSRPRTPPSRFRGRMTKENGSVQCGFGSFVLPFAKEKVSLFGRFFVDVRQLLSKFR